MSNNNNLSYRYNSENEQEQDQEDSGVNRTNKRNQTNLTNTHRANKATKNEQDMHVLVEICELMGEQDTLSDLLVNPLLASERNELLTIYKLSRMENDERLLAYGTTFRKIGRKLQQADINRQTQIRNQQNAEYERGLQINMARANLQSTLKAKRNANRALLANSQPIPQNIKRILQQGRYAKPEHTRRATNYMNSRQQTQNAVGKRLAKYNDLNARLFGKHFSLEEYQEMKRTIS